jgi:hypothetical protein
VVVIYLSHGVRLHAGIRCLHMWIKQCGNYTSRLRLKLFLEWILVTSLPFVQGGVGSGGLEINSCVISDGS